MSQKKNNLSEESNLYKEIMVCLDVCMLHWFNLSSVSLLSCSYFTVLFA